MAVIGGLGFAPANDTIVQHKRDLFPRAGGGAPVAGGGSTIQVNVGASWGVGILLLVFTLVFDLTVGPVCYAIVGECSSTRLRQKTVVLARMAYNVCRVLNNIHTPLQLNPGAWNWEAKSGLFWSGICLLCIAWTYFRLPETGGRTYGELNLRSYSKTRYLLENSPQPKLTSSAHNLCQYSKGWPRRKRWKRCEVVALIERERGRCCIRLGNGSILALSRAGPLDQKHASLYHYTIITELNKYFLLSMHPFSI